MTLVATPHPSATPIFPPPPITRPGAQPQPPGNFLDAQAGRSTECVRETRPRLLASLSPTWASSATSPSRRPRAWGVLTSPRQRRGRAVGEEGRVRAGERCHPQLVAVVLFFISWTRASLPTAAPPPSRPCHALSASFLSSCIVSLRFLSLLFCRLISPA